MIRILKLAINPSCLGYWVGFLEIFVIEPTRAFKKARGLWNESGPGFIGLLAYVVQAWHEPGLTDLVRVAYIELLLASGCEISWLKIRAFFELYSSPVYTTLSQVKMSQLKTSQAWLRFEPG